MYNLFSFPNSSYSCFLLANRTGTPAGGAEETSQGTETEKPNITKCGADADRHSQAQQAPSTPETCLSQHSDPNHTASATPVHCHITYFNHANGSKLFCCQCHNHAHVHWPAIQPCHCPHTVRWVADFHQVCLRGQCGQDNYLRHGHHSSRLQPCPAEHSRHPRQQRHHNNGWCEHGPRGASHSGLWSGLCCSEP